MAHALAWLVALYHALPRITVIFRDAAARPNELSLSPSYAEGVAWSGVGGAVLLLGVLLCCPYATAFACCCRRRRRSSAGARAAQRCAMMACAAMLLAVSICATVATVALHYAALRPLGAPMQDAQRISGHLRAAAATVAAAPHDEAADVAAALAMARNATQGASADIDRPLSSYGTLAYDRFAHSFGLTTVVVVVALLSATIVLVSLCGIGSRLASSSRCCYLLAATMAYVVVALYSFESMIQTPPAVVLADACDNVDRSAVIGIEVLLGRGDNGMYVDVVEHYGHCASSGSGEVTGPLAGVATSLNVTITTATDVADKLRQDDPTNPRIPNLDSIVMAARRSFADVKLADDCSDTTTTYHQLQFDICNESNLSFHGVSMAVLVAVVAATTSVGAFLALCTCCCASCAAIEAAAKEEHDGYTLARFDDGSGGMYIDTTVMSTNNAMWQ